MSKKVFYQITRDNDTRTADINIYGDITSNAEVYRNWWGDDGSVSARDIKSEIEGLDVDTINVYINSYGGEVAEALAIYTQRFRDIRHRYIHTVMASPVPQLRSYSVPETSGLWAL